MTTKRQTAKPLALAERYTLASGKPQPVFADQFIADNIPTKMLFPDYTYARPLTATRIRKLDKTEYDTRKVGMLLVSMRNDADGSFALIDGQGRMYLALKAKAPTVPARVYMDLNIQQEAELYLAFNRDRDETTAVDDYVARLVAKEPLALGIQDVLESLGLKVMRGSDRHGHNSVQAISSIESTYKSWGADGLRYTLRTLREAWPTERSGLTGDLILGLAAFAARIPALEKQSDVKFDHKQLVARLQAKTPAMVKGMGKAQAEVRPGMHYGMSVGRAILVVYDAGRRNKLGEWPERQFTEEGGARAKASSTATAKARRGTEQASQASHKAWATRRKQQNGTQ